VVGGAAADTLTGGAGNDTLTGGSGSDSITGGDGADSITGDSQGDYLIGGSGNDTITGGTGNDQIFPGEGIDTIYLGAFDSSTNTTEVDRVEFQSSEVNQIVGLLDLTTCAVSSNAVISTAGVDKIFGFGTSAQLAIENIGFTLATTLLRSGDLVQNSASGNGQSQGLVRGTYDPAAGTFTVSLTGTSSLYFYDSDTASGGISIRGVVLVGYVDAASNDTGGATGIVGVGG